VVKNIVKKEPDFVSHSGFAEFEVILGCWIRVSEEFPTPGSGPLRLGVKHKRRSGPSYE